MTRSELAGQLWTGVLTVTFIKKDGTQRTITGTQDPTRIPFYKHPKTLATEGSPVITNRPACSIFDLTLEEWRSFSWDSVHLITSFDGQVQYDVARDGGIQ